MEGLNSGESAGIALGPVLLRLGLLSFSVEAMIVEVNCVLKMKKDLFYKSFNQSQHSSAN